MADYDKIKPIAIEDEIRYSYIDYAMSVIVGRALPDVRDGLKPVHRRILYAMKGLNLVHNKPYKKSARIVGEVLGKYHPHGDLSVYDALVRMVQYFSMRYPLIDGQGNFGSVDGDGAAAMRYTEVRMNSMAEEVMEDIDKNTVDFVPNYDDVELEPVVLPAKVPLLLLNGSSGIAVGMATNVPPHNLGELSRAMIAYIEDPQIHIRDLMKIIPGPDFPTGSSICGVNEIFRMYSTGRGHLHVKAKAEVIELKTGREQIIVTEIPYAVNKSDLIERIASLVREKRITGISDIRDESDKDGIRIVIEIKKAEVGQVVLNQLYKFSNLKTTFGGLMLALVNGRPQVMGIKQIFYHFINHRQEVIRRRTQYELDLAEKRAHILEGFLKALDHLDEVIQTIRSASDRQSAHRNLIEKFAFSDEQTKAILEMRLYQITGLEREKVEKEYNELLARIEDLKSILADPQKVNQIIKDELIEMSEKYSSPRRTEILPDEEIGYQMEDLIADETCVITITHSGYIKRTSPDLYKEQRRGGKGIIAMETKDEDFVEQVFTASTHDTLLFFTESGLVSKLKVYQVPDMGRVTKGKAIVNLLELEGNEKIATQIRIREYETGESIVLATEKGIVKKTYLKEYQNIRRKGIQAIRVDEGDRVESAKLVSGNDEIVLVTRQGKSIRFSENDLRNQGRTTRGVQGIQVDPKDAVVGMEIVQENAALLIACENGYGKRSDFDDYRKQRRGGKGVMTIRDIERNGVVVRALSVTDDSGVMMITSSGKMIRVSMRDVSVIGRHTKGYRLISLNSGDRLVDICLILEDPTTNQEDNNTEETVEVENPSIETMVVNTDEAAPSE